MQKFLILGTETFAWNSSKRRELEQRPLFTYDNDHLFILKSLENYSSYIFQMVLGQIFFKFNHFSVKIVQGI